MIAIIVSSSFLVCFCCSHSKNSSIVIKIVYLDSVTVNRKVVLNTEIQLETDAHFDRTKMFQVGLTGDNNDEFPILEGDEKKAIDELFKELCSSMNQQSEDGDERAKSLLNARVVKKAVDPVRFLTSSHDFTSLLQHPYANRLSL